MPKYIYHCKECDKDFEIRHSLQEACTICEVCGIVNALVRRPSTFILAKKESQIEGKSARGGAVKKSIEELRSDLKEDQENLKGRMYEK